MYDFLAEKMHHSRNPINLGVGSTWVCHLLAVIFGKFAVLKPQFPDLCNGIVFALQNAAFRGMKPMLGRSHMLSTRHYPFLETRVRSS